MVRLKTSSMIYSAVGGPLGGKDIRLSKSFFETPVFSLHGMKGFYSLIHPNRDKRADGSNVEIYQREKIYWHDLGPVEMANGWFSMIHAPKNAKWVLVLLDDDTVHLAHYACNLSGEEQPPFKGWFVSGGGGYVQIKEPVAWKPVPGEEDWKPMHEAPKDGTRIRMRYYDQHNKLMIAYGHFTYKYWYAEFGTAGYIVVQPIAWKPV